MQEEPNDGGNWAEQMNGNWSAVSSNVASPEPEPVFEPQQSVPRRLAPQSGVETPMVTPHNTRPPTPAVSNMPPPQVLVYTAERQVPQPQMRNVQQVITLNVTDQITQCLLKAKLKNKVN